MSIGSGTIGTPGRADGPETSLAGARRPEGRWTRYRRAFLSVALSLGVWALLATWSGAAHADEIEPTEPCASALSDDAAAGGEAEQPTCDVAPAPDAPDPLPVPEDVATDDVPAAVEDDAPAAEPGPDAPPPSEPTPSGDAVAPGSDEDTADAQTPGEVSPGEETPTEGPLVDTPLVDTPLVDTPLVDTLTGRTPTGRTAAEEAQDAGTPAEEAQDAGTPAEDSPLVDPLVETAALDPLVAPAPDPLVGSSVVDAVVDTEPPDPLVAPVLATEPEPVAFGARGISRAAVSDSRSDRRVVAVDTAGTTPAHSPSEPSSAPVIPVSPAPVGMPLPLPATAPPAPLAPAGPVGSPAAASSGWSFCGPGQTNYADSIYAVLDAQVAASLAEAALRPFSGFAGDVVGGADDSGARPG